MSDKLHAAMKNIIAMPYYKNESVKSGTTISGHEDAVGNVLANAGFTEKSKKEFPALSKGILKAWAETGDDTHLKKVTPILPLGCFIKQPAGSQGFPDILVKDFDDRLIALECKSVGKSATCPMWNDSIPRPDSIYILNSGKYNETTVFLGRDVITNEERALMDTQSTEMNAVAVKYQAMLQKIDKYNRGWVQKSRKQHFQQGGGAKTNYFTHKDRAQCEENVLNFVK
jgi:hypothetical protein